MILIAIGFILIWLYAFMLIHYGVQWLRLPVYEGGNSIVKLKVSIVIIARNEELNIVKCIDSIIQQNKSEIELEIILVDDNSEDSTSVVADSVLIKSGIDYCILNLKDFERQGKKSGIELAVNKAKGDYIILRDADTVSYSQNWLVSVSDFLQNEKSDLLILPIQFEGEKSLISQLQILENNALTILSGGSVFSNSALFCNGANLAFKKESFIQLNPYQDNKQISSGDDMFLLQSAKQKGLKIDYLRNFDVVATTISTKSIAELLGQRARWMGKMSKIKDINSFCVASLVYLSNVWLPILLVLSAFNPQLYKYLGIIWALKFVFDFLFVLLASVFFRVKLSLVNFFVLTIIYPFYTLGISLAVLFVKPNWKGRKISNV